MGGRICASRILECAAILIVAANIPQTPPLIALASQDTHLGWGRPVPTTPILRAAAAFVHGLVRSRLSMQIEILALRHQLAVYQRTSARPRLKPSDRIRWAWLSRAWSGWREALVIVKPETVIAWRRRKFRQHWARLSRSRKPGRPAIHREIRDLIRRMSIANPLGVHPGSSVNWPRSASISTSRPSRDTWSAAGSPHP